MPERWPVIITGDDGDEIEVELFPEVPGKVFTRTSPDGVMLGRDQLKALIQARPNSSRWAALSSTPALLVPM